MLKMEIKSESLPKRCEICHQSDHFNAVSNTCNRCGHIEDHKFITRVDDRDTVQAGDMGIILGIAVGVIISLLAPIFQSNYTLTKEISLFIGMVVLGALFGAIIGAGIHRVVHKEFDHERFY